ncbi:MAG: oligosaccharide flippase family protein [Bacteroidota bacterium]
MLKISEFTKSIKSLSKDVFVLSAGILIAQLIPLLLQPVLKRIFTPEDFGTYDVFLKSFGILVALSCLKYENAILLPKKDGDAKHVVHLCLIISASVFLLLVLAFFFLHDVISEYLDGFTKLALILLPISVLSYSIFNIFNMYLIRRQRFMLSWSMSRRSAPDEKYRFDISESGHRIRCEMQPPAC